MLEVFFFSFFFAMFSRLAFVGVCLGGGFERLLPSNGELNLAVRHLGLLLAEAVGHDHGSAAVDEVEHSEVHVLLLRPQFVDVISQEVGFWPPQLVPELS